MVVNACKGLHRGKERDRKLQAQVEDVPLTSIPATNQDTITIFNRCDPRVFSIKVVSGQSLDVSLKQVTPAQ